MLTLIILGLLVALTVGAIFAHSAIEDPDGKVITKWSSIGLGILTVLVLIWSVTVIVPTREVGIMLTFAKPTGTLSNGLHLKAPWQHVETMDAAIQTDNHVKDGGQTSNGEHSLSCVTTRIAHQAVACVDTTIRWRIIEPEAGNLFQDYRTFDNVRDTVMESYDVLAVDDQGQSTAPELSEVATDIQDELTAKIGDQIEVLSVIIPVVHFDDATQGRVNALQGQIAQTRISEQAEQTAKAQANANRILAESVSNDPNVLVSKCLDLLNESITKNYQLPAGFSCWSGAGSVVIPAVK
jgi:regulator of protease activity HflC (stomatin/prohibitin superfamily)